MLFVFSLLLHQLIVLDTQTLQCNQKHKQHENDAPRYDQEPVIHLVVDVIVLVVACYIDLEVNVVEALLARGFRCDSVICDCCVPARVIHYSEDFALLRQVVEESLARLAVSVNLRFDNLWPHFDKVTFMFASVVCPELSAHNKAVVVLVVARKEVKVEFVLGCPMLNRLNFEFIADRSDVSINVLIITTGANESEM